MDRRMHEGPGRSALGFDVAITRVLCKNEYRGHDEYKTNNVYPAKRSSQPQHREQSSRNRFDTGDNARFRCANIFDRLEIQRKANDGAKQHQTKEQEQPARDCLLYTSDAADD